MMSGTKVLTGEGKMVVIVVGDLSCNGKIRAALNKEEVSATPLQMKL
jgi:magnesium-transporting ATPase (P-type)